MRARIYILQKWEESMKRKKLLAGTFFLLNVLCGCSPSSLEDFHCEGESRCRALVHDLQKIHNREELTKAIPTLKKHFEELVTLMIHAREFQENHPDENVPIAYDNTVSSLLEEELRRIYAMEGGREMIEHAQQEALVRLDGFERACAKKRQALPQSY
jgi:hypothetical protein